MEDEGLSFVEEGGGGAEIGGELGVEGVNKDDSLEDGEKVELDGGECSKEE